MKGSWTLNYLLLLVIASGKGEKGRRFEVEHCAEIIPQFIDHLAENGNNGECGAVGQFPKPGDCTVFFKCVRGRGRILPILEYCAIGYNFDGHSCIRSTDLTDCPQFNCKMINDTAFEDETIPDLSKTVVENTIHNIAKMPMGMSESASFVSDRLQSAAQKSMEDDHSKNGGETFRKLSPFGVFFQVSAFNMMLHFKLQNI